MSMKLLKKNEVLLHLFTYVIMNLVKRYCHNNSASEHSFMNSTPTALLIRDERHWLIIDTHHHHHHHHHLPYSTGLMIELMITRKHDGSVSHLPFVEVIAIIIASRILTAKKH